MAWLLGLIKGQVTTTKVNPTPLGLARQPVRSAAGTEHARGLCSVEASLGVLLLPLLQTRVKVPWPSMGQMLRRSKANVRESSSQEESNGCFVASSKTALSQVQFPSL